MSKLTTIQEQLMEEVNRNHDTVVGMVCFVTPNYQQWNYDDSPSGPQEYRCTVDELPCYMYDSGYGLQEGPSIRCYSERYIYYSHEYDGAEWVCSILRNPE